MSAALLLSPSGGLHRLIARLIFSKVIVSDAPGRPHSHRPHDASVAHLGEPFLGVPPDDHCRSFRAPAFSNSDRDGRALPGAPVRERDGCGRYCPEPATVASPLAAALGSPAGDRLVSLRVRSSLPAIGGRARSVRASAFSLHLHVLHQWFQITTRGFAGVQKAFAGGANV